MEISLLCRLSRAIFNFNAVFDPVTVATLVKSCQSYSQFYPSAILICEWFTLMQNYSNHPISYHFLYFIVLILDQHHEYSFKHPFSQWHQYFGSQGGVLFVVQVPVVQYLRRVFIYSCHHSRRTIINECTLIKSAKN